MNVIDIISKGFQLFDDQPDILVPDKATKTQVINANSYNNNSTNNWMKMLLGKGGVVILFAFLYFAYRRDNREQETHNNEERRKEEIHQARLKRLEKKED